MAVFCSHGIGDPLVASLMLEYLVQLQRGGGADEVLLFTEEPPGAPVDEEQRRRLAALRVEWVPLRYDVRGAQWRQKARIMYRIWSRTRLFMRRHERRWLVGFLVFGGAYAVVLECLGLGRSAVVCFEPHSRYMVEMGAWGPHSPKAAVMAWLERMQMHRARLLLVPTSAGKDLALAHAPRGKVVLQPIAIDVGNALFDPAARMALRKEYGLEGHTTLAYVGKFGGIYYTHGQYLRFVQRALEADGMLRFLVIAAQNDLAGLRNAEGFEPVKHALVLHGPVQPEALRRVLSAADLGVIAVPPTPSQAYRTPVKTAHYWAAGLPLVVPEGISDDWAIARQERLGIVTGDLVDLDPAEFRAALDRLREEPPEALRKRCMEAALRHRDSSAMVSLLAEELGLAGGHGA